MPCMMNGRPVPGVKGKCPFNSKWSDTSGDGEFQMADVGDWAKKRYFDKDGGFNTGTAAMDSLWLIPGTAGLKAGMLGAKTAGSVGAKGIGSLINKMLFKSTKAKPAKTTTTLNPNNLKPNPVQQPHWVILPNGKPMAVPFKPGSQFKPYRSSTTRQTAPGTPAGMQFAPVKSSVLAATGLGLNEQFGIPLTQSGQEAKAQRQVASATSQVPTATPVDPNATKALETQKESERVAGLGFFDKMKEPGYWDTSITGVEGDDRLSRMGDLLTYYGMPPSGRAAAGQTPSEMWKQRSIDAAAAVANASGVDSPYSKIGNKTGIEAIAEKVKKDFGNTWLPFDVALGSRLGDDEVEALAREMHIEIVRLADMPENKGKMTSELYEIAKKNYET